LWDRSGKRTSRAVPGQRGGSGLNRLRRLWARFPGRASNADPAPAVPYEKPRRPCEPAGSSPFGRRRGKAVGGTVIKWIYTPRCRAIRRRGGASASYDGSAVIYTRSDKAVIVQRYLSTHEAEWTRAFCENCKAPRPFHLDPHELEGQAIDLTCDVCNSIMATLFRADDAAQRRPPAGASAPPEA
jgi:hypothetical protein